MKKILFLLIIGSLCISSSAIAADTTPWQRNSISLGGFAVGLNSSLRVGSQTLGTGIDINLEDGLGLDSVDTVFRVDTSGRFGKGSKHRIDLSYFFYNRDSIKVIQKDIDYNDISLSVGESVSSKFNIEIFKLGYGYSLLSDERLNFDVGLGLFVMPIETSLNGSLGGSSSEDITAPLPTVNLHFDFALTDRSFLRQSLDLFYLELGDFRGGLLNMNVSYEYMVTDNVSLGLGVESMRIKIEAEGSDYPEVDFIGNIGFSYFGAMFFAKYYF